LHAEAARGLPFKVVFLVGLEERVFPRIIREDPFLRDDARAALRDTVGYKIGQKLTALEEERLLFHLITTSPTEKLILVYQRTDDSGNVVGASSFLRSYAEEQQLDLGKSVVSVPRPLLDKINEAPLERLAKREIVIKLLAAGEHAQAGEFVDGVGGNKRGLNQGLTSQQSLHRFDAPTAYDGLIGPHPSDVVFRQGMISPSALETYGRCPFQYFATRLLGLKKEEPLATRFDIPADEKGKRVHLFLARFFGLANALTMPDDIFNTTYNGLFEEYFPVSLGLEWRIPSVLWESLRNKLFIELKHYLHMERIDLRQEASTPTHVEYEWKGTLAAPLHTETWVGKIDRVDVSPTSVRVVDYKTGRLPKKVSTEAVRGLKAQPPLYLLMAEKFLAQTNAERPVSFEYHQVGRDNMKRIFSSEEWNSFRPVILKTIQSQVALMREGNFIMLPAPNDYCNYCPVESICRKNHGVSVYRSEQGAGRALHAIRKQSPKKES
jgi:ATP-dependent helicase/nuclease subunit B